MTPRSKRTPWLLVALVPAMFAGKPAAAQVPAAPTNLQITALTYIDVELSFMDNSSRSSPMVRTAT